MNNHFFKKYASLYSEYSWLEHHFPLPNIQVEPLTLFNLKHVVAGNENVPPYVEAGVCQNFFENETSFGILFEIHPDYQLNEHDKWVASMFQIEEKHFYYWMLYHEYGHLVEMNQTIKEKGFVYLHSLLEKNEKKVNRLLYLQKTNRISEKEKNKRYRELPSEKRADSFANEIYQRRKKFLP